MKSKEMKNLPELRFPEFKNATKWELKNGNIVFEQISNKEHNSDLPVLAITQEYGAIPRDMIDYNVSVTSKSIESYKVVEINDFIVSLRSFQGGIEYSKYKGICSPAYIILRKKIDIEEEFFKYYFKTHKFIQDLNKNLEGIRDGKMVSYKQFSDLSLPIPSKKEQQKIADCLSSLDNLITAQSKKVEALKEHKKGLMQQLFPQDEEEVPKLRFPEFGNSGKWKEKILDDVADYENGKAHENDISENGKYIVVNSKFISTEGNTRKYTNNSFCMANIDDVLMFLSDVPKGRAIAKCYLVESDDLYTVNQRICKLTAKENYISKFLFYILDRNKYFLSFDDGVKQTNLRKEDVLNCPMLVPSTKEEQEKIADFLSAIDELITSSAKKVEALKEHKKGLMQQLFPSAKES